MSVTMKVTVELEDNDIVRAAIKRYASNVTENNEQIRGQLALPGMTTPIGFTYSFRNKELTYDSDYSKEELTQGLSNIYAIEQLRRAAEANKWTFTESVGPNGFDIEILGVGSDDNALGEVTLG